MTSCSWKIQEDQYKKEDMMQVDVSQELSDLMAVYVNAYNNSSSKTEALLGGLICGMKAFIEAYETTQQIEEKINTLRSKICQDECDEGCE